MIRLQPMNEKHIEEISQIEMDSFSDAWSRSEFERELTNKIAIYIIALKDNSVIGYAGMWHVVNEGQIVNVAVKKENRRQGVGALLLNELINIAKEKEMIGLTLEVRASNKEGQCLYEKFGFIEEGRRKRYYAKDSEDSKEDDRDALIMWKYFNA